MRCRARVPSLFYQHDTQNPKPNAPPDTYKRCIFIIIATVGKGTSFRLIRRHALRWFPCRMCIWDVFVTLDTFAGFSGIFWLSKIMRLTLCVTRGTHLRWFLPPTQVAERSWIAAGFHRREHWVGDPNGAMAGHIGVEANLVPWSRQSCKRKLALSRHIFEK